MKADFNSSIKEIDHICVMDDFDSFDLILHLNETSIATGDPSRGSILERLLELWPISSFFNDSVLPSHKVKTNFSQPCLELISSGTSSLNLNKMLT